ncbi:MAG: MFS transporter [Planctomycetales bacterium]
MSSENPWREEFPEFKRDASVERIAAVCAGLNAAMWGLGAGLASTNLAVYLALELNGPRLGLGIGMLLAAPHLAGLLRLFAPSLIGRVADRKRFCLAAFVISAAVLASIPLLAAPERLGSASASLCALTVLWCLYHLFEYLGVIALWSWLGDLVPAEIRGGFLGKRQRCLTCGRVLGMLVAAGFLFAWKNLYPDEPRWHGYAVLATAGAVGMVLAVVPLAFLPHWETASSQPVAAFSWRWMKPLLDSRFLRLLVFGCWFSAVNGLTQAAQGIYPYTVLGFSLVEMLCFKVGMHAGQAALSPVAGRLSDRLGNRPVLMVSLVAVAMGPLFFFLASPERRWLLAGAWVAWIAYAGLNVCLPNLTLKLSDEKSNAPYLATYFAITSVCYATGTIVGGSLHDGYIAWTWSLAGLGGDGGTAEIGFYDVAFVGGCGLRLMGVIWLWWIIEPGAPSLGRAFRELRSTESADA